MHTASKRQALAHSGTDAAVFQLVPGSVAPEISPLDFVKARTSSMQIRNVT